MTANWAEIEIIKLRRIYWPRYGKNENRWPDNARRRLGKLKSIAKAKREAKKAA